MNAQEFTRRFRFPFCQVKHFILLLFFQLTVGAFIPVSGTTIQATFPKINPDSLASAASRYELKKEPSFFSKIKPGQIFFQPKMSTITPKTSGPNSLFLTFLICFGGEIGLAFLGVLLPSIYGYVFLAGLFLLGYITFRRLRKFSKKSSILTLILASLGIILVTLFLAFPIVFWIFYQYG